MITPKQFYFKYFPLYRNFPTRIQEHEFGFNFGGKIQRHLSFSSIGELTVFVFKNEPTDIYCSNARYSNPSNRNMKDKEWLGADLIFDIDAKDYKLDCINKYQLSLIKKEVKKLVKILRNHLGFTQIDIYFSGNNGFHIYVSDDKILTIPAPDRREIAQYLIDNGIKVDVQVTMDIHRIFRYPGSINSKSGLVKTEIKDIDKFKISDCNFS